jgi:hypothetical protein
MKSSYRARQGSPREDIAGKAINKGSYASSSKGSGKSVFGKCRSLSLNTHRKYQFCQLPHKIRVLNSHRLPGSRHARRFLMVSVAFQTKIKAARSASADRNGLFLGLMRQSILHPHGTDSNFICRQMALFAPQLFGIRIISPGELTGTQFFCISGGLTLNC